MLEAALDIIGHLEPQASRRASSGIAAILAGRDQRGDRGYDGKLTGDGYPVEFVFSSLDPAVRYTCEAGGLVAALETLRSLGVAAWCPLEGLQEGSLKLEWGAWIGARHDATSDRYKLYAEVPEALSAPARFAMAGRLGRSRTLLESHVFAPRIVGWDPSTGCLEIYFRARQMESAELRGVFRLAGFGEAEESALWTLVEDAGGEPIRGRLPGAQQGFSLSVDPAGRALVFSFFVFARSFFGTDAAARAGMLALAEQRGWNAKAYSLLSAPLAQFRGKGPCHGIVSFIVDLAGRSGVAVGLRPPAAGK
jgi:hypothetical protein